MALKAVVREGRLVLDEPAAELPEGTVLELVIADESDDLEGGELAALNEMMTRSLQSIEEGKGIPAEDVIAKLRARSRQ